MGSSGKKMPYAIWRITIALILGPPLLFAALLPSTGDSIELAVALLSIGTAAAWTVAALLLRHYGKWPWNRS